MIIQRLYELAQRENLLKDLAFEKKQIPFMVSFDKDGKYLGILDRRVMQTILPKTKTSKPKSFLDDGKEISVPRAHGNTATKGFACYFIDTLPRVLPFIFDPDDEAKSEASRKTFWGQITLAANDIQDPALLAAVKFGQKLLSDPDLKLLVEADIKKLSPKVSAKCGLVLGGEEFSLTEKPNIAAWYGSFFNNTNSEKQEEMEKGFCQITGLETFLPKSHGFKFQRIPNGLSTGSYLISLDKPSFQSYGLDKAINSGIGVEAAQSYSLALQALIDQQLPSNALSKLRIGENLFLFWTREVQDLSFMNLLDRVDAEEVRALLSSPIKGGENKSSNPNDFYLMVLSANAARIVVRDYLEAPLSNIQLNLVSWFKDLSLVFLDPQFDDRPFYSIYELVKATSGDKTDPLITTPNRLLMAALRGDPLSDAILSACLRRMRLEGSKGCTRPRLSLIKLFLVRKGIKVTESLNTEEKNPAYLYGRLLEIFDEIQYAALGDVNAGVVDKFYGTFSAAPALIMARLFANANNHLRKLKNEKPGAFVNLDRKLTELVSHLPIQSPKGQLPLREQALFALGFYHQRAFRNQERVDRKTAKDAQTVNS